MKTGGAGTHDRIQKGNHRKATNLTPICWPLLFLVSIRSMYTNLAHEYILAKHFLDICKHWFQ